MEQFFSNVKDYYVKALDYIFNKFPLDDELLEHARVANVRQRRDRGFDSVLYFVERFPCLQRSNEAVDVLQTQFETYQITPFHSSVYRGDTDSDKDIRIDSIWVKIGEMTDADGTRQFKELSEVMLAILSLFHANADCERIFNLIRGMKTELHDQLLIPTLNNMLVQKCYNQARNIDCFDFSPDVATLRACKAATNNYNEAHPTKPKQILLASVQISSFLNKVQILIA